MKKLNQHYTTCIQAAFGATLLTGSCTFANAGEIRIENVGPTQSIGTSFFGKVPANDIISVSVVTDFDTAPISGLQVVAEDKHNPSNTVRIPVSSLNYELTLANWSGDSGSSLLVNYLVAFNPISFCATNPSAAGYWEIHFTGVPDGLHDDVNYKTTFNWNNFGDFASSSRSLTCSTL